MTEDYNVDPRTIHIDQRKRDTRRDAWNRDYGEFEEACKIEPKKDYTIWLFAIFFCFLLILMSGCTTLEVGVQYGKIAYNKCADLDNWQCLWYDE